MLAQHLPALHKHCFRCEKQLTAQQLYVMDTKGNR